LTPLQPKQFNIAGPCDPSKHYLSPVLPRWLDLNRLITGEYYFVLQAPHQSGKTTFIQAAVRDINRVGFYYALYCPLERLSQISDVDQGMSVIIDELSQSLRFSQVDTLKRAFTESFFQELNSSPDFQISPVEVWLGVLSEWLDKDLVVFFDDVDRLKGEVLSSFLFQLYDSYIQRIMAPFPRSIVLCGASTTRDYQSELRSVSQSLGMDKPFTIIKHTLTLENFSQLEIEKFYAQHTEATGQIFNKNAVQRAWYWSEGQPWLVNALASHAIETINLNNFKATITAARVDQAADNLIRRRDSHLDSLLSHLSESRVKRFIESTLAVSEVDVYSDANGLP
jgi:hypothetical protein